MSGHKRRPKKPPADASRGARPYLGCVARGLRRVAKGVRSFPAAAAIRVARAIIRFLHLALHDLLGIVRIYPAALPILVTSSQIDPVRLALACNISQAAKRSASHSRTTRKAHTMATPAGDMLASPNSRTMTKISAFMAAEYSTPGYRS